VRASSLVSVDDLGDFFPEELKDVLGRLSRQYNERDRSRAVNQLRSWFENVATWRRERGLREDGTKVAEDAGEGSRRGAVNEAQVELWLEKIGPDWVG
jgi:hypothetical protein